MATTYDQRYATHAAAIRVKERRLDALLAYLRATKRPHPAPTQRYQYPGFDLAELRLLMAEIEAADALEQAAFGRELDALAEELTS